MKNFEKKFNLDNLTKDDLSAICEELQKMLSNVRTHLLNKGYTDQSIRNIFFVKEEVLKRPRTPVKTKKEYQPVANEILYEMFVFLTEELGIDKKTVNFSEKNNLQE
jgi:hypothetical protein